MTQRLTIRNNTMSPSFVHTVGGPVSIGPGEQLKDLEFNDGEAKNLNGNTKVFTVEGYQDRATDAPGDEAGSGYALDQIAAALGTDKNGIMDAIAALKAKAEGKASSENNKPMTLAEAIKSLDDKADGDWIGSGQPNLERLKSLTGGPVTRADIDALPEAQRRVRVKPE